MRTIRNFIRGRSIRFKLLFYFLSLIILPITILGILGNVIYGNTIQHETNVYTTQMIEQVRKNTEFYVRDMENIIYYLSNDAAVMQLFQDTNNDPKRTDELKNQIKGIMKTYTDVHPEIAGIMVVNSNDVYVSNEMSKISRDPLTIDYWYKQAVENPNKIQLISKPIGRNISTSPNYIADDVLSVVKAVTDKNGNCLGVILIDLKLETIKKVIEGITLWRNGFIFIADSDGGIIYAPVNSIVYRVNYEWLNSPSKTVVKNINNNKYQIIYEDSTYTNWKTVGVFSLNEALKEVTYIRNYTLLVGFITVVFAFIAALFFTSSITRPINKLRALMKMAEDGDLNVSFKSKYKDEIGQLGESFNNMIGKIRQLIQIVYFTQKSKREAELTTLQAQIKPHFLYNTLDTIQWMAEEYKANDIIEIVGALTTLFRISLSKGREMIKVSEELEHVKSYLVIQMARYEGKLNYNISFQKEVLNLDVMKLILQPLVENAIYHGIKEKRGKGTITINAEIKESKLYFKIKDDGAGISQEKLAELNKMIEAAEEEDTNISGYGIFNVNERIRLSFGNGYGLKISSVLGEGTTIEIWHPIIER